MVRQAFAIAGESKLPRTRPADSALKLRAECAHARSAAPVGALGFTLKSVAAQKAGVFFLHVAETGHVDNIGPIAERGAIFIARENCFGATALDVIHQI